MYSFLFYNNIFPLVEKSLIQKYFSVLVLFLGVGLVINPIYFYTKGYLAQILLEKSWQNTKNKNCPQFAWSWAAVYPVGKIIFPTIKESHIILNNTTVEALAFGPGLVENTSLPGQSGNICIAGHRDSFFKNIRNLNADDPIKISGINTEQIFKIKQFAIVYPENISWISSQTKGALTLITCYPFEFTGNAPLRYIIRAELIASSDDLDNSSS